MKKALYIIEILLFLTFVGVGLFRSERTVVQMEEVTLEGSQGLAEFRATPGVYRVTVAADIPKDCNLELSVACVSAANFRALLQNAVNMRAGQEDLSFEFYVTSTVDSIRLQANMGDAPAQIDMKSLTIQKTNLGFFMLAVMTLLISTAVNLLIYFRKLIRDKKISLSQQVVVWVLMGCVLLTASPLLSDAIGIKGDTPFHLMRIEGLKNSILQWNQFPIRVQSYWMYDHGYQVSMFYGDLFLLPAAFLRICGFSMMETYRMLVIGLQIATAWITYFCFRKCVDSRYGALFGTVIYMLAPYRIYNFYNRGAIGECMGMTFFPLVVCGIYLMLSKEESDEKYSSYKYYLVAGFTCLLQSHLISTAIALFCTALVCLVLWKRTFRRKTLVQLLQGVGITLALNCWFWLPILQMMAEGGYLFTSITAMELQKRGTELAGVFQLVPYMGGYQEGMYNCEPIQVGAASLVMLASFFAMGKPGKESEREYRTYRKICMLLLGAVVFTLFMSTRYFPWDTLLRVPLLGTFLGSIQIPTRLVAAASVFGAFYAVFFVCGAEQEKVKKRIVVFFGILAVGTAVFHLNDIVYNTPPTYLHTAENLGTTAVFNGEYLLEGTKVLDYYYHEPMASESVQWSDYQKEGTDIQIHVENTTSGEGWLELPLIAYRGYEVVPDGEAGSGQLSQGAPYISEVYGNHGDLKLCIPAGYVGDIEVSYQGLSTFRVADVISLLGIVGLVVIIFIKRIRRKQAYGTDSKE